MRVDLHNHTHFCNHATGLMEEYIKKAIELGIDIFGFSCHAPMDFDTKYRMSINESLLYEDEIERLQKKYENKIEILKAYEVDYINGYIKSEILEKKVDYFIGSVHFIHNWGFDNPEFIGKWDNSNYEDIWKEYFLTINEMVLAKLFDVVGHLDLIKVFNKIPNKIPYKLIDEVLKNIKKSDMVLEINGAGFRKDVKEQYPSFEILKRAKELNIPITFGSDAHSVEQVGLFYLDYINIAKGLGYTEIVTFKDRKRKMIKF